MGTNMDAIFASTRVCLHMQVHVHKSAQMALTNAWTRASWCLAGNSKWFYETESNGVLYRISWLLVTRVKMCIVVSLEML